MNSGSVASSKGGGGAVSISPIADMGGGSELGIGAAGRGLERGTGSGAPAVDTP